MALRLAAQARSLGHLAETATAVVVKQPVALPGRARVHVEDVGLHEYVEPPVAVIVAERAHPARVIEREPAGRRLLAKRAVALIDIEQVRRSVTANVQIKPAVVVHIGKRDTLLP